MPDSVSLSIPSRAIYLDHAATTPVHPQVVDVMAAAMTETYGNPSSLHRAGKAARKRLEQARQTVADCLGAQPEEIHFTSGGTESDNLAILGVSRALRHRGRHLIVSAIEHSAILNPCQHLEQMEGFEVTYLNVDAEGFISTEALKEAIRPDTVLISIMHGNNEVGTLQDLASLGQIARQYGVAFHTDAVQTVGKVPINLSELPIDYLSASGHKLYGPKGVGLLFVRQDAPRPAPLALGGAQEQGFHPGTENLAGIVGLAEALRLCCESLDSESTRLRSLQESFLSQLEAALPDAWELNGPQDLSRRVPGNINLSFPPVEGEAMVLQLDLRHIAVSSGSACNSREIRPSKVILALGKTEAIARSTVRFSMGRETTEDSIQWVVQTLKTLVPRMTRATAGVPDAVISA